MDPIRDIADNFKPSHHNARDRLVGTVSASSSNQEQNHYEILGVAKDATKQEIHRAFRQLAKKYHPDKNKDKSATDEFIKIFKAYETLSDEKKRKEYDDQSARGHTNSWTANSANNVNDFDINDFFKQYEDQFLKHAQHFNNPHQSHEQYHQHYHQNIHNNMHHNQFKYHGVNLDDLFHDIDEDEFNSFGRWFDTSSHNHDSHRYAADGHFGDGASFFGSHMYHSLDDALHQYQHQHQHQHLHQHHNYHAHDGSIHSNAGYSCQTTTKHINGVIMTQTSCS